MKMVKRSKTIGQEVPYMCLWIKRDKLVTQEGPGWTEEEPAQCMQMSKGKIQCFLKHQARKSP